MNTDNLKEMIILKHRLVKQLIKSLIDSGFKIESMVIAEMAIQSRQGWRCGGLSDSQYLEELKEHCDNCIDLLGVLGR